MWRGTKLRPKFRAILLPEASGCALPFKTRQSVDPKCQWIDLCHSSKDVTFCNTVLFHSNCHQNLKPRTDVWCTVPTLFIAWWNLTDSLLQLLPLMMTGMVRLLSPALAEISGSRIKVSEVWNKLEKCLLI